MVSPARPTLWLAPAENRRGHDTRVSVPAPIPPSLDPVQNSEP